MLALASFFNSLDVVWLFIAGTIMGTSQGRDGQPAQSERDDAEEQLFHDRNTNWARPHPGTSSPPGTKAGRIIYVLSRMVIAAATPKEIGGADHDMRYAFFCPLPSVPSNKLKPGGDELRQQLQDCEKQFVTHAEQMKEPFLTQLEQQVRDPEFSLQQTKTAVNQQAI